MNLSYLCLWYEASELAVPKLTAQESAALVMIAASILVFRTFRERYLLVWTVGWLGYFASRWALRDPALAANCQQSQAVSQASFVLAVCLFATAILIYSNAKKLLLPIGVITGVLLGYAVARALLWPDSVAARIPLEIAYRLVLIGAAAQMLRARWGRWLADTPEGLQLCRRWKEWVAAQVKKYDWDIDPDDADHPTIHGLRGTGILARAEQGYEVDQIANDIGMSRQNVEHYMRFRDQMKVGADGQKRLRLVNNED